MELKIVLSQNFKDNGLRNSQSSGGKRSLVTNNVRTHISIHLEPYFCVLRRHVHMWVITTNENGHTANQLCSKIKS